jgi:glycosyltransferase involved in cell wall biosynthesis
MGEARDGDQPERGKPPSISVVFPMYNEEAYIHRAVRAARSVLSEIAPDHEIVIVDDASTDATGAIADQLASGDPRIRVVHNPVNRRLGGTLRAGYAVATKDLVVYTDADLPFDLQELGRAVRLLEYQQADVLAAYRFDRTAEGFLRTVYSFVYNLLIRVLFGLRIKDVNFSFKLFRRSLLERFPLRSEGSFIDVEFLARARKAGAAIIQIGVDYFPRSRGVSTLSSPGVILKILREMVRLYREIR